MRLNYKRLGDYIKEVNIRNKENIQENLLGVSVTKEFIPSVANTNGTDWKKYKVIMHGQFCYIPDTSRRGDKMGIALLLDREKALVSQAYTVFEIIDQNLLLPEYLILWFKRPEFDRYARFMSHGSVREIFDWEKMCNVILPIPDLKIQMDIVRKITIYEKMIIKYKSQNELLSKLSNLIFSFAYSNIAKEQKTFSDFVDIVYGKGLPVSKLKSDGYYVYGGNGIIGKYSKYLYEESVNIVSCRGEKSGNNYITHRKSFITSNSLVFKFKSSKGNQFFLKGLLDYTDLKKSVTGSAQPQITIQNIERLLVDLPSDDTIISAIDRYLKPIWNKMLYNEAIQLSLTVNYSNYINFNLLGGNYESV